MYLMYVDESGDSGVTGSPTPCFVLTGLVVHELRWQKYLEELIGFRRDMRQQYGLKLREEFHASHFITRPGELLRIGRHDRLAMIRSFADRLAAMTDLSLVNIVVKKQGKGVEDDVFALAWKALIQRFENTVRNHNFPGPANPDERGLILCDHSEDKKIMQMIRQMRRYNPVPNLPHVGSGYRNLPLLYIIEDPSFRDSAHSYFVQAADLAAFLLYQHLQPNVFMRKKSGNNYFKRLSGILCRHASRTDPDGIVWL